MSTILDALRKARTEDPDNKYATSRVFTDPMPHGLHRRRRWILPAVIIGGLLILLVLAGSALFYVLHVMPRLDAAGMRSAGAAVLPPTAGGSAASATPASGLPTPAPVSQAASGSQVARTVADLPTPVPADQVKLDPLALSTPPDAPEAGGKNTAATAFRLGTIVWDENRPLAIINDDSVREGDVREDFTVIDITPNTVTIRTRDGGEVILRGE